MSRNSLTFSVHLQFINEWYTQTFYKPTFLFLSAVSQKTAQDSMSSATVLSGMWLVSHICTLCWLSLPLPVSINTDAEIASNVFCFCNFHTSKWTPYFITVLQILKDLKCKNIGINIHSSWAYLKLSACWFVFLLFLSSHQPQYIHAVFVFLPTL